MDPEQLFHASQIELVIPSYSSCPAQPEDPSSSSWWTDAQNARTRDTAYLDEHLEYYVGLSIDDGGGKSPSHELKHFLSRLQLTMTASFLPPLPSQGSQPSTATRSNHSLQALDATPRQNEVNLDYPPVTPMPQPAVKDGDEQYAAAEGQVVWEGQITDKYKIYKGDVGWVAVWKGEVKIEYMRTNIRDPVLALTASVTLRDAPVKLGHKRGNFSIDTISTRMGGDDWDEEDGDYGGDGLARMDQFDLLGGLAEDPNGLPATRLGQRMREDLYIPESPSRAIPPLTNHATPEASSPAWLASERSAPTTASTTTLRKSYRRVLAMHSGLNVRMRALCLPQLLSTSATEDDENEGEKKMVLCIEIVNPEHEGMAFEIEAVNIEIAGNGGKATAELVCQPGHTPGEDLFPLTLQPVEQYNLLYGVNIAAAPEERNGSGDQAVMRMMGRGDDTRPAAIFVVARPCIPLGDGTFEYPTKAFNTRWNSQLDLAVFYASLSNSPNAIPASTQYQVSKGPVLPPNPVAGDKRFSIASFASTPDQSQSARDPRRLTQRPLMPSQAMNGRVQSMRQTSNPTSSAGLLVSVKLLPGAQNGNDTSSSKSSVKPFEPFSVEVFIHNRTDEVRRFRLSIPPRDGDAQIRETIDKRKSQHQSMIQDDPVMRQMLLRHLASAPALVPLEADIRCGPLLPGASLAARIRFMALREGVHKVEKLVITGVGDDWNFVMSPGRGGGLRAIFFTDPYMHSFV